MTNKGGYSTSLAYFHPGVVISTEVSGTHKGEGAEWRYLRWWISIDHFSWAPVSGIGALAGDPGSASPLRSDLTGMTGGLGLGISVLHKLSNDRLPARNEHGDAGSPDCKKRTCQRLVVKHPRPWHGTEISPPHCSRIRSFHFGRDDKQRGLFCIISLLPPRCCHIDRSE